MAAAVVTCAAVFSRGLAVGFSNGRVQILLWHERADDPNEQYQLVPLCTSACHDNAVARLRRISTRTTEGRSELLVSMSVDGKIAKISLPSGRVIQAAEVPFRPIDVVAFDSYLLVYGQSSEIHILYQSTLDLHTALSGLPSWPIPLYLFDGRIVTLNARGEGQLWRVWEQDGKVEPITASGAGVPTPGGRRVYGSVRAPNGPALAVKTHRRRRDAASVHLGDAAFGAVRAVHSVGEVLWLAVHDNGWTLHHWEADNFVELHREPLEAVADAITPDAADTDLGWFAVWSTSGAVQFATVDAVHNVTVRSLPGQADHVEHSLAMCLFYRHEIGADGFATASAAAPAAGTRLRTALVDFFYSGGKIYYRFADMDTMQYQQPPIDIERPRAPERLAPLTPPVFDRPDPVADPAALAGALAGQVDELSLRPHVADACTAATMFDGLFVFGCGRYLNAYSLTRFMLTFDHPEHSTLIPETGARVTMLQSCDLDGRKVLLVGLSSGNLYILDNTTWELSHRVVLFGAPVRFAAKLGSRANTATKNLVAVSCRDGTVAVVDVVRRASVYTMPGHFAPLYLLAMPRDSNILMAFYEDQVCRLCNLRSGKIENQNGFTIDSDDGWELHYIQLQPKLPKDVVTFTHSWYTIDGSATIVVNVLSIVSQLAAVHALHDAPAGPAQQTASILTQAEAMSVINIGRAVLSTLFPRALLEQQQRAEQPLDSPTRRQRQSPTKSERDGPAANMIQYVLEHLFVQVPAAADVTVAPAKLGARGVSDTLSVVHPWHSAVAVSGEITAMVVLTAVVLAKALLDAQVRPDETGGERGPEEHAEAVKDRLLRLTARTIFRRLASSSGPGYRQPWLRGFARFWTHDYDAVRHGARLCLRERIEQLSRRPKDLSTTVARWRLMLPGVHQRPTAGGLQPVKSQSPSMVDANPLPRFAPRAPAAADGDEPDPGGSAASVSTHGSGDGALEDDEHDFFFNIDVLTKNVRIEETLLSVIILANIAIEQPEQIANSVHREIVTALQMMVADGDDEPGQDVAIELIGLGWRVWADRYFYPDDVLYRLMVLFGEDRVAMSRKREGEPVEGEPEQAPGATSQVRQRHNLLVATARHIGTRNFNRVVEVAAHKIRTDESYVTRIGAIKFIVALVRSRPLLLVDRLFPVVDATVETLDPAAGGVRNKVVNTITMFFNEIVGTYPFFASHRAQQQLAMAIRPDTILVYDLRSGSQQLTLEGASGMLYQVTFSPEGRHIMAVDPAEHKVYVWKLSRSFMSLVKSIGGAGPHELTTDLNRGQMFPRFSARLKVGRGYEWTPLKAENDRHVSVQWDTEKVFTIAIDGVDQTFDYNGT
ncbi:uncharacterized protein V1510DRAFT_429362 [Dipodascopsis tothii]|uniref:uncharacterized protein n=1 Tax=Dipodascopsis tothii TaxID=44089 RepID=UPI0034CE9D79